MTASSRKRLRALFDDSEILILPGAPNAYVARLIEEAGFSALLATGAGIANFTFGLPDLGLLSSSEVLEQVRAICSSVSIPVIADIDTGFGNALNVHRTVRLFEHAGVAAVQMEDQVTPKRCGHFDGKAVIESGEMVEKIQAFKAARRDPDLMLVARTDAIAVHGLDEGIRRGRAYAEAGADVVFVEAPRTDDELQAIAAKIDAPLLANMVEGGRTPLHSARELQDMGYSAVAFANMALRVGAFAIAQSLEDLADTGTSDAWLARMLPWEERQRIAGLEEQLSLARSFVEPEKNGAQSREQARGRGADT